MWAGGVRVVIKNEKDQILMVRQRHEGRDIWMIPGGGVELNETSSHAAAREVKEETGLEIVVERMIWHIEQLKHVKNGGTEQRFVDYFEGRVTGGCLCLGRDPELGEDEQVLREVRFMSNEEIRAAEHVYPSYLKDELWEYFRVRDPNYDPYKIRV